MQSICYHISSYGFLPQKGGGLMAFDSTVNREVGLRLRPPAFQDLTPAQASLAADILALVRKALPPEPPARP